MSTGKKAFLLAIVIWVLLFACCGVRACRESAGAVEVVDDGRLPGDDIPATQRCFMTPEEIAADWAESRPRRIA